MSIDLHESLENRNKVIRGISEEIIGPGTIEEYYKRFNEVGDAKFNSYEEMNSPYYWVYNGIKEEILKGETPSQKYVSGILFPFNTEIYQDDVKHSGLLEDNEIIAKEDKYKDSETLSMFEQRNEFAPSSIGMTVSLEENVDTLIVDFSGGVYKPHRVHIQEANKHLTWWLRRSITSKNYIDMKKLVKNKSYSTNLEISNLKENELDHLNLKLSLMARELNNRVIVTISVSNYSNAKKVTQEELKVFQSTLTAKTQDKQYFAPYPKLHELNENLSEDTLSNELLYMETKEYGFGHGCSVQWNSKNEKVNEVSTTFLPNYEALSMTPDILTRLESGEEVPLKIYMKDLAQANSQEQIKDILEPMIEGYSNWIMQKKKDLEAYPSILKKAGKSHLKACEEALNRINKGVEYLKDNEALKAFKLANQAIILQQQNGKISRNGIIHGDKIDYKDNYEDCVITKDDVDMQDNSWRAFQIAFFLMSVESIVKEESPDREIVDLIWFPTGGGKTEAYLGVAAFQMLYRRIQDPTDAGVDVIMRYTLRLLTADQFQRSSRLILSLEYIRRNNINLLGAIPFSIGIWVGQNSSPNKVKEAKYNLNNLMKNNKKGKPFALNRCPWCGAVLGHYHDEKGKINGYYGYTIKDDSLIIYCPDNKCEFHEKIPVYMIDDDIYKFKPTFLIGTIDKFVQLVWNPNARAIFGIDFNGSREVAPPSLIIQDELHLISGPLGSLSGMFELLIEELSLKESKDKIIKPKIIASTATIKHYEQQVKGLFGREKTQIFPPPGISANDSYFSKPAKDDSGENYMPGRLYVGVYPQTVQTMMTQVMVYSNIIQTVNNLDKKTRDPYWTILSFYNTIKELGMGQTLIQTDIPQYSKTIVRRKGYKRQRNINKFMELTSRKQSSEVANSIDELKEIHTSSNQAIDICLASNIIEVGIDIDRLSLMTIVGQPKMTSQYIQVSGRVGRRWWERPGLIATIYNNNRSRDKSYFEHFLSYHQKLYAQVETTSVTPFSELAIERGLKAIFVGFLRQYFSDDLAHKPDIQELSEDGEEKLKAFHNRIIEKVRLVDPEQEKAINDEIKKLTQKLIKKRYTHWNVEDGEDGFMYRAGTEVPVLAKKNAVSMMNTMRNVDAECKGIITDLIDVDEVESKLKKGAQTNGGSSDEENAGSDDIWSGIFN